MKQPLQPNSDLVSRRRFERAYKLCEEKQKREEAAQAVTWLHRYLHSTSKEEGTHNAGDAQSA